MTAAVAGPAASDPGSTEFAKTQPLAPAAGNHTGPIPICAAPQRRDAVVLFAELRGLANVCGVLDPGQALALASEFYGLAADQVAAHGGEAVAVHHDALLAVFARSNPVHAAQHAIRAAQQTQGAFGAVAERWRRGCGVRAAVSHGMHLGEVVLGLAGPRGMERKTAFGESVALAHRILRRARAGEIVMSDAVMGALSVENLDLDAEPLPPLELPRRQPLRIYGVLLEQRLDFT
jgi:class 3 adenylate cyclase